MLKNLFLFFYSVYFISFGAYEAYLCRIEPENVSSFIRDVLIYIGISSISNIFYGINYILRFFNKLIIKKEKLDLISEKPNFMSCHYFKKYIIRNIIKIVKISINFSGIYFTIEYYNRQNNSNNEPNYMAVLVVDQMNLFFILLTETINTIRFYMNLKFHNGSSRLVESNENFYIS